MLLRTLSRIALPPATFAGVVGVSGTGLSAAPARLVAQGAPSGYAVTGIHYRLDRANPAVLDGITFSLTPANAATVRVRLSSTDAWHDCRVQAGLASCDARLPLRKLGSLEVSAAA